MLISLRASRGFCLPVTITSNLYQCTCRLTRRPFRIVACGRGVRVRGEQRHGSRVSQDDDPARRPESPSRTSAIPMAICTRSCLPATRLSAWNPKQLKGTCIDFPLGRVRPWTLWSRADRSQPGWSRKSDDEPSPLLRRLVGNGLAHLRSRVGQRSRPSRQQLPDFRVGPGGATRVELPCKLAQAVVRRAQRAELEYLIISLAHRHARVTTLSCVYVPLPCTLLDTTR